jgi:N utilization substance protein A
MDEILANKIAAGEVVERIVSIVKELVENSIDAKSDEIKIELIESGLREIKITDNGIGMDYDAYMPKKEALPTENLVVGENVKVYITKVEETGKGPKVFVSRTNVGIVKRLFENAVPEVADGTIEIVAMARDAGNRTKIGVRSTNPNVEAKGACVGLQGIRIKQINDALNGERIDIFVWNDDPVQLIAQAISPAKVLSVLVYPDLRQALVIVPDMQYSLAIGQGGQNARLASQVTGWKIDIKDESTAYREKIKFKINVL